MELRRLLFEREWQQKKLLEAIRSRGYSMSQVNLNTSFIAWMNSCDERLRINEARIKRLEDARPKAVTVSTVPPGGGFVYAHIKDVQE